MGGQVSTSFYTQFLDFLTRSTIAFLPKLLKSGLGTMSLGEIIVLVSILESVRCFLDLYLMHIKRKHSGLTSISELNLDFFVTNKLYY